MVIQPLVRSSRYWACSRRHKYILLGCFISLTSLQAAQTGTDLCIFILGLFLLEGLQKKSRLCVFRELNLHTMYILIWLLSWFMLRNIWSGLPSIPFRTWDIFFPFLVQLQMRTVWLSISLRFLLLNFDDILYEQLYWDCLKSILRPFTIAKGINSVQYNYLCKYQCIHCKKIWFIYCKDSFNRTHSLEYSYHIS